MKFMLGLASATLLMVSAAHAADLGPGKPEFLGQIVLPTGLKIAGVEFGGISGLDYDAVNDVFYAISDDRSERAPARFYTLKLGIGEKGVGSVDILTSHQLTSPDGKPFAAKSVDPESIRFDPRNDRLFWSSEGDKAGVPSVTEAKLDGTFVRQFQVPDAFLPNADKTRGIQSNLAFEPLAIAPDGKTLWTGTENALVQDGPSSTLGTGSRSRLLEFDIASGKAGRQFVYETDPIHTKATKEPFQEASGLTEFLFVDAGTLLAVERSFAQGAGNEINLYLVSLDGATDVSADASIKGKTVTPVSKRHLLKIGEGDFGLDIDNIESVTFGPAVAGKRTLVIASDNNFNPAGQFTQFVVFTLQSISN